MRGRKNEQAEYAKILALPYTKLKDGYPYVRIVRKVGGRKLERKRRVHSVADALSKIEELKQELGLREPDSFDGERMTFIDLMKEYEKARKIPMWYKDPLLDHFGDRRIRSITYGDIVQFKRIRAQVPKKYTEDTPRSPATINRELELLRSVFLYALRHEWILKNPFSKGPAPLIKRSEEESRYRIPSTEEEARILEFCTDFKSWIEQKRNARGMTAEDLAGVVGIDITDRIERGERLKDREITMVADAIGVSPSLAIKVAEGDRSHLRAILIVAKDTGLRKGALLSLIWSMVGFKVEDGETVIGDFIRIPKGPRNKKRPPAIGITARLREELSKLWQDSDKQPTSQIFGGVHEIKRSYNTVCRIAGVVDLHFHDWRHGYATDMVEAGVEERLAMIATGHTNAETHAIYTNVDERIARMIAGKLDALHAARQPAAPRRRRDKRVEEEAQDFAPAPCFFDLISHTDLYEVETTSCAEGSIILSESPPWFASNKGDKAMSIELSEIKSNNEFLYQAIRANVGEGTLTLANVITRCKSRAIPKETIIEAFRKELFSKEPEAQANSDLNAVKQALEKGA